MNLKFFYAKQLYQLKQKITHLSERDKVLLLFITVIILFTFWFLVIWEPQTNSINELNQKTEKVQGQIDALTQKKMIISILISNPNTAGIIKHFNELTTKLAKLNKEITRYNERYISSRNLAKLLHDMLKQTLGVTIDDFSTVPPPIAPITTTPQTPPAQIPVVPLSLQATHYRLIIRGTYFPIMNYLQHLEQLPWQLYWDKFDYTVTTYPEGIATVEFYTLKPQNTQLIVTPGHNE